MATCVSVGGGDDRGVSVGGHDNLWLRQSRSQLTQSGAHLACKADATARSGHISKLSLAHLPYV
eukprot:2860295-Pleurochrysis_carterae.AAC.1